MSDSEQSIKKKKRLAIKAARKALKDKQENEKMRLSEKYLRDKRFKERLEK